jgi:TonB family protein
VLVHLILITVALKLTSGAAETVKRMLADPSLSFLTPPPAPPSPRQPERRVLTPANSPPSGFHVVVPPRVISTEIPPISLHDSFDPRNFTGHGIESDAPVGDSGLRAPTLPFTGVEVDDPVQATRCPEPSYPPALRTVGVSGSVALRYVVGVDGRAEAGSISVISSTNKAFEAPAIETVTECLYRPARIKGAAVRQLVQQNVKFTLGG